MIPFSQWPWRYWAHYDPDAVALINNGEVICWRQLASLIDRRACHFDKQGVDGTCTVMLRGKNSLTLLINYLALLQLAAKVLVVNPQIPMATLLVIMQNCGVNFIWDVDALSTMIIPNRRLLTLEDPHASSSNAVSASWLIDRPATLILTSGSTGVPKAVVHSLYGHLASAQSLLQRLPFTRGECWLLSLPLYHVSGQSIVWRWLLVGACLALAPQKPLHEQLIGCTHASLVPTQLWRLLNEHTLPPSLKHVLLGGSQISTDLTEQAEKIGLCCWCGYGLTEMAATVCVKVANHSVGVGQLLPARELKIVNEQIYLRGAGLAMGYWQAHHVVPFVDKEGWFATRDRGYFKDHEWVIRGRVDTLFFSGGEAIQPEDIEQLLLTHPAIEQALILPIPDEEFGQRPVALIHAKQPVTYDEIITLLAGKLARYQYPVALYPLPEALCQTQLKLSRSAVQLWLQQFLLTKQNDKVAKKNG